MPADRRGQVAAERQAGLDDAVPVAGQELDGVDADVGRGGALFGLADGGARGRREAVDAGLTAGDQQVADVAAGLGPFGDGRRGAVFEVVGVGHDGQRPLPVVGHRAEGADGGVLGRHRGPFLLGDDRDTDGHGTWWNACFSAVTARRGWWLNCVHYFG